MKPNYFHLIIVILAAIGTAALWQWAQNGRYVYHGAYVIDSRTGVVTKVDVR